jgi:hypothetical protein
MMSKNKKTYQITLETDQMAFIREARERYKILDVDKVVRIIMDYVITSPELHTTIFTEPRCLRCD